MDQLTILSGGELPLIGAAAAPVARAMPAVVSAAGCCPDIRSGIGSGMAGGEGKSFLLPGWCADCQVHAIERVVITIKFFEKAG